MKFQFQIWLHINTNEYHTLYLRFGWTVTRHRVDLYRVSAEVVYTVRKELHDRCQTEDDGQIIIGSRSNLDSYVIEARVNDCVCLTRLFTGELELPITDEEFMAKSNALYLEAFPSCDLLPGAERLVKHLAAHRIPIGKEASLHWSMLNSFSFRSGIGTGSSHDMFLLKTNHHQDLFKLFAPVICTEATEVRLTKPAPDIFLACADKFPKSPLSMSQCLVFEDAENGIRAALSAGMKVVFVPSLPLSAYDPAVIKQATITLDSLLKFDPVEFGLPPYDDA